MSSEDNDKSTEQVLEYYRKYSQNQNLPKYFSGSSVSYLPPVVSENETADNDASNILSTKQMSSSKNVNTVEINIAINDPKVDEESSHSTSLGSPSETKILEWDNGADIGYSSAKQISQKQLKRSLSLPDIESLNNLQAGINMPKLVPSTVITHSTSEEKMDIMVFSSSDSGESDKIKEKPSSQSEQSDETKFVDFQKSINFLKKKIGLPGAHSTPNVEDNIKSRKTSSSSSKSQSSSGNNKLSEPTSSEKESWSDIVSKPQTRPSLVAFLSQYTSSSDSLSHRKQVTASSLKTDGSKSKESCNEQTCVKSIHSKLCSKKTSEPDKKSIKTKIVELSISTPININCKCINCNDAKRQSEQTVTPKAVQTENVTYRHIETQFNSESNKVEKCVEPLKFSDDIGDSASSFEYIKLNRNSAVLKLHEEVAGKGASISGVLKEITLPIVTPESGSVSKTSSDDIDRHLETLQKLLKTKKLNSSTKRKYVKDLLKYLSDLETSNGSSTSSDLFIPKKDPAKPTLKSKLKVAQQESNDTSQSNSAPILQQRISSRVTFQTKELDSNEKENLNVFESKNNQRSLEETDNLPSKECMMKRKQTDKENANTFLEVQSYTNIKKYDFQAPIDEPKPNVKFDQNKLSRQIFKTQTPLSDLPQCSPECTGVNEHNKQTFRVLNSNENLNSNLPEAQGDGSNTSTLSSKPSDDYLIKFAENERTYQLNWINNEITHLSRLKKVLESKKPSRSKTSIYKVQRKEGGVASNRNYVIETKLDGPSTRNINYRIDGQKFSLSSNTSQNSTSDDGKAIIADIVVSSDEMQTNIKVKTICSRCKQVSCICTCAKTMQSKIPSLITESENPKFCLKCQRTICVCIGKQIYTRSSNKSSKDVSEIQDYCEKVKTWEREDVEVLSFASDAEGISQEDFNSLQRVFEKCNCTIKRPNCGCNFVKKLLDKFHVPSETVTKINENAQTDVLTMDKASSVENGKVRTLAIANQCERNQEKVKTQTYKPLTENTCLQVQVDDKSIDLQTTQDVDYKDTQTLGNENYATTQTNPKINSKDKKCCTCGNVYLKNGASQVSTHQDDITIQTEKKLLRSDKVQVGGCLADEIMQTETMCQGIQTESNKFDEMGHLRSQKYINNESNTLPKTTEIIYGIVPEQKLGESKDVGVQAFPNIDNNAVQVSASQDHKDAQTKKDSVAFNSHGTQVQSKKKDTAIATSSTKLNEDVKSKKDQSNNVDSNINTTETSGQSTTITTNSETTSSSRVTCLCCKQKAFLAEVSYLEEGNDSLVVCSRCYYSQPRYCLHNSRFTCRCSPHWHYKPSPDAKQICRCCRMEVLKCPRKASGLKYTVTISESSERKEKMRAIKANKKNIKVQDGWSEKSVKDKENYNKKEVKDGGNKDQMKKERIKKHSKEKKSSQDDVQYTLTEYLIKNRPQFVCAAEYRRQMLLNSRIVREKQKEDLKLNFLDKNFKDPNDLAKYKLFTEREMKDINRKNYKKLPEVQDKLLTQRECRLRCADKLISNVFAKKVQKSVLRGKGNFPIDRPLTNL